MPAEAPFYASTFCQSLQSFGFHACYLTLQTILKKATAALRKWATYQRKGNHTETETAEPAGYIHHLNGNVLGIHLRAGPLLS